MTEFEFKLPLAQTPLDRDYKLRDQLNWTSEVLNVPSTKLLPMSNQKVLLHQDGALRFVESGRVTTAEYVYLGKETDSGSAVVLAILGDAEAHELEPDEGNWHELRKSGLGLSPDEASIFTQALSLANWHASHQFCPTCGASTESIRAGWVRRCTADGRELFPRTDPAIIVAVIDEQDRILMGSQGVWEENRFSILAGFVEPGESLTAAVKREMFEEAGVHVSDIRYLGSQAWPFPYSLMLGFTARYAGGDAIPDGEEIVKLRWFSRGELRAEAASLKLPGRLSIARAIIEHWLGSPLETEV
jgi:NAD+ diphosphatase